MGCERCDKFSEDGAVFWYRWKAANIGIIACEEHAKEIIDALNEIQKTLNQVNSDAAQK